MHGHSGPLCLARAPHMEGGREQSRRICVLLQLTAYPRSILELALMLSRFSRVQLFVTPWTVARQAPLSMGFSRQEYWSGLLCSLPGVPLNPGIEPMSLMSPTLAGRFFTIWTTWEAQLESISKNVMTQHTTTRLSLLKLQLYLDYTTKTHDSGSHCGSVMASEAGQEKEGAQVLLESLGHGPGAALLNLGERTKP